MKQVKTQVPGTAVYYTSWMDKKPVHVLSTFTASQDVMKWASKNLQGNFCKIDVTRPAVIGKYNYGMPGTDKIDQQMS